METYEKGKIKEGAKMIDLTNETIQELFYNQIKELTSRTNKGK